MNEVQRDIAGARRAHAAVIATLRDVTDEQVGQPSRLPGWTLGHVATHIARNADGQLRMVEAAQRGEVAAMYPGGREQRAADIEAGAGRSAAAIVADVEATAARLEQAWAELTDEGWAGSGQTVAGPAPVRGMPFIRWREVIVHHADLGLEYTWRDWDPEYVRVDLQRLSMQWASRKPMGMTGLPAAVVAVPANHRVAWLLGRAEIDGLGPAGIMG